MVDNDSAVDQSTLGRGESVTQTYDWAVTSPSAAVVETVAAATGVEPTALDTLQHTLDADSLDTLVRETEATNKFTIEFRYAGTAVMVTAEGTVRVTLD